MKFKYELTRKTYEKTIKEINSKNNIWFVTFGSLIYLFCIKDLILDNFLLMLVFALIAGLIIYGTTKLITFFTTKLIVKMNEKSLGVKYGIYDCTLTKEKFIESLDGTEISIDLKDIVKTTKRKNQYEILTNKMIIVFNKTLFQNKDDYNKAVEFVEKNKPHKKEENIHNKKEK